MVAPNDEVGELVGVAKRKGEDRIGGSAGVVVAGGGGGDPGVGRAGCAVGEGGVVEEVGGSTQSAVIDQSRNWKQVCACGDGSDVDGRNEFGRRATQGEEGENQERELSVKIQEFVSLVHRSTS